MVQNLGKFVLVCINARADTAAYWKLMTWPSPLRKVQGLDTSYSIMWPSIARANRLLDPRCS